MGMREWIVTATFTAFLYAAIEVYMFPMLGERVNLLSAGGTFLGTSMLAWGFARILTNSAGKMAWAVFIGGAAMLVVMWYAVF